MADKILLIEDDFALAMGTEYALSAEGYEVIHADCLEKARSAIKECPNLILLDVMLPDGNGFDFCKEIRACDPYTPIIFLTAVGEECNIVQGLELGADDYVTKPYRLKELLSRISTNLRRSKIQIKSADNAPSDNTKSDDFIYFGSHKLIPNEFRLYKGDIPVELTASEFRLLNELVKNEGIVLSKSQILERLYDMGDLFIDDNTLYVYVKRLRDKLGDDASFIHTVRGIGYRFERKG